MFLHISINFVQNQFFLTPAFKPKINFIWNWSNWSKCIKTTEFGLNLLYIYFWSNSTFVWEISIKNFENRDFLRLLSQFLSQSLILLDFEGPFNIHLAEMFYRHGPKFFLAQCNRRHKHFSIHFLTPLLYTLSLYCFMRTPKQVIDFDFPNRIYFFKGMPLMYLFLKFIIHWDL